MNPIESSTCDWFNLNEINEVRRKNIDSATWTKLSKRSKCNQLVQAKGSKEVGGRERRKGEEEGEGGGAMMLTDRIND